MAAIRWAAMPAISAVRRRTEAASAPGENTMAQPGPSSAATRSIKSLVSTRCSPANSCWASTTATSTSPSRHLEDRGLDLVGVLVEHRRDHDRAPGPFLGLG